MEKINIWDVLDEIKQLGYKAPLKECIAWLNNDERVNIYNIYTESNFGVNDDGMNLILTDVENFENYNFWIESIIVYLGTESAEGLALKLKRVYDL